MRLFGGRDPVHAATVVAVGVGIGVQRHRRRACRSDRRLRGRRSLHGQSRLARQRVIDRRRRTSARKRRARGRFVKLRLGRRGRGVGGRILLLLQRARVPLRSPCQLRGKVRRPTRGCRPGERLGGRRGRRSRCGREHPVGEHAHGSQAQGVVAHVRRIFDRQTRLAPVLGVPLQAAIGLHLTLRRARRRRARRLHQPLVRAEH